MQCTTKFVKSLNSFALKCVHTGERKKGKRKERNADNNRLVEKSHRHILLTFDIGFLFMVVTFHFNYIQIFEYRKSYKYLS